VFLKTGMCAIKTPILKINFRRCGNNALVVPHPARSAAIVSLSSNFVVVGRAAMSFLKEFLLFLKTRKKFWLIPAIIVLLLLGAMIVLASGSALAPFIYTIF
jgi:hypothetical protein